MPVTEKIYIILCTFFAVLLVTGNLIYQKFVTLSFLPFHTFELSIGAILYPLTFLLTDLIAEFYGREKANFCVQSAIAMNVIIAFVLMGMDALPATEWSKIDTDTFHHVFGFYSVAFIGSILACYVAQRIDILLYLGIRKLTGTKWLWLRNNASTSLSLLIDTSIVISFMTFFGVLPFDRMGSLILNSYLFKLFFSICSTPLFYACVGILRWLFNRAMPAPSFQKLGDDKIAEQYSQVASVQLSR